MRLKNLLLSFGAFAVAPAFATTYYVTPEGAGNKDGLTPENAFGVEEFREQALKNVDGDVYKLAAGTYKPSACIIIKKSDICYHKRQHRGENDPVGRQKQ